MSRKPSTNRYKKDIKKLESIYLLSTTMSNLRIPAFMRSSQLKRKAKKKILFTALDRKQAGLHKKKRKRRTVPQPKNVTFIEPLIEPDYDTEKISQKPTLKYIGEIIHYFEKINVGVIEVESRLRKGDIILINKNTQVVQSMQINRKSIKIAKKGDDIGIKLNEKADVGDKVFLLKTAG